MCILWELFLVKTALKKIKPDNVLFPRGYAPVRGSIYKDMGVYVIIHDMIPFYYDKNFHGVLNPVENFYIMWRLKASSRLATGVITDSEYSKKDIARIGKVREDKIHVVYPGFNKIDTDEVSASKGAIIAGLNANEEYICAICSGLPHKNAEGVVKSYIEYHKLIDAPLKLVIIGLANLDDYSVDDDVAKDVICIKYLEKNSDMHSVMAGSKLFWFLSRQEGFGFPPLESMQLGVPVICSDASSLPEVVGDAAVLVGPEDHEAVARKTVEVLSDNDKLNELIKKGNANVDRFIWEKQVDKYWDVF